MDPWDVVKWIAIFRLILPEALFRLCGGRVENLGELQATAVKAGLNGVMMGNFLTTLGNTPDEDQAMFTELGLNVAAQRRQRRQPPARQPLRVAGGRDPRPRVGACSSRRAGADAPALTVRLWDPTTQLRFAAKRSVPPRPDGAPNSGQGRETREAAARRATALTPRSLLGRAPLPRPS